MISDFGKKTIAVKMFLKGTEFIGAFELLRKNNNYSSFVQIYLLIQGIEILCKGTLLLEDYDKYSISLSQIESLK